MIQIFRPIIFLAAAVLFGLLMLPALRQLPSFGSYQGPYGDLVLETVSGLRHTPQGVAAVTFDYRGFDTLGEEFILFAAVAGVLLLMRVLEGEHRHRAKDSSTDLGRPHRENDAVRGAAAIMFPLCLVLGIYIVVHGHLTPGGGFQGGALLSSAFTFAYLCGEYGDLSRFCDCGPVEYLEAAGAGAFATLAAIPLLIGLPFMSNILPLGTSGRLLSAGNLPLLNVSVGLEVAAGFLLVLEAFLGQVVLIRKGVPK